ncbi:ATP-binding protein [Desulfospira joergensenii]|uniref:ATP-binding protein n=1 Tax=Desulfospira joergensenii TaxID=53329 RepID=UPI0013780CF3|nr:ATP-binding protein [Desulfospira joergensenii]
MIFHPVILKLDQLIRRLFFRSDAISIKTMHEFSHRIAATLELPRIINAIIRKLPEAIHVSSIAVMIFEGNRSRLFPPTLRFGSSLWRKSRMADRFKDTAITHFSVFQVLQDPDLEKELQEIQKAGFTLVLPLRSSRALSGFLFIGPKVGGSLFNEADILLLGSFANQATIALENALHHESLLKGKQQLEQMFEQKVQAEKMAAIGEMTSLLAHELKNPLGIIHSSAQYLAKGKQSRQVTEEMVAYIIDEVDHLNLSINSILNFARQKPPELARVNLEQEIKTLMDQWIHTKDHRRTVTIQIDAASKLPPVYVDFRQLAQVLLNLIRNSEEMMADGGKINIHLEQMRDHVHIRIIDNGPGISHENQDKVFDNFFTTKNQGLGLGLSACRQIIQAHNGSIFLTNRTDNDQSGASALIKLPVRPLENIQKSSMLKMLPT